MNESEQNEGKGSIGANNVFQLWFTTEKTYGTLCYFLEMTFPKNIVMQCYFSKITKFPIKLVTSGKSPKSSYDTLTSRLLVSERSVDQGAYCYRQILRRKLK